MTIDVTSDKINPLGFSLDLTDEIIEAYRTIPFSERLRWLEENLEFMYKALTKEQWETIEKFRQGEI